MTEPHPTPPHPRFQDLTGRRFGRLTVLSYAGKVVGSGGRRFWCSWLCRCDCGAEKILRGEKLRRGRVLSCGCSRSEAISKARRTHGMSGSPEYQAWHGIIRRCGDSRRRDWPLYGARGIKVCKRYAAGFAAFYADLGPKPGPEYSIDRPDGNAGYDCGRCRDCRRRGAKANCRWATPLEQGNNTSRNRRLTHGGETLTVSQWARRLGMSPHTLYGRLRKGWPPEKVLRGPR